MANNIGKITQIIGAVLDIKFTEGNLPEINDAIKVPTRDGKELVVEVSQHLGDDIVRCIAMGSTDGLVRGMDAIATGAPISVPVGENTLGRMFNVLGNPIDEIDPPTGVETWPIHRKAPAFEEQATSQEMLETGIKVVDLLCPCPQGVLEGAIPLALGNAAIRSALGKLFSFKCLILITVIVLSILFYRPFCKWICPLGAIYSLFNKVSFLSIKIENSRCIGCGQCQKACKMDVDVCKTPDHPECIRCGACIKACPKDAIHYQFMGKSCKKQNNSNQQS